jgi:hypothetical protein
MSRHDDDPMAVNPLIAVVIPAFKQPQYLTGAALSALDQRPPVSVRVVVVNDGCPFEATHEIGTAIARAHPDRVRYVRQPNRGLSAARNAGVEAALAAWPDLDAIFPLDADNLLSPGTLAALWDVLARDPALSWASPDLEIFGDADLIWHHHAPFSTYKQLFENQTDAGMLIRRPVFESGLRYVDEMPAFEDWLFVLEAALAGFTGAPAGPCGFRYRRRKESMLIEAQRSPEPLKARIRARVPAAYAPAALVGREHAEAPRFTLLAVSDGATKQLTATDLEPARCSASEYLAAAEASSGGTRAGHAYVPPVTIVGSEPLFAWLEGAALLPGVLLRTQLLLRRHVTVGLRLVPHGDPGTLALALAEDGADLPVQGVGVRTRDLLRTAAGGHAVRLEIHAGALHAPPVCERVSLPAASEPQPPPGTDRTLSNFCAHLHIDTAQTTFPWSGAQRGRSIWFVVPAPAPLRAGDAAVRLSAALHALEPEAALHLLAVGTSGLDDPPAAFGHFDTVTMLAQAEAAPDVVAGILAGADVVVHGDSGAARAVLAHVNLGAEQVVVLRSDAMGQDALEAVRVAGARRA